MILIKLTHNALLTTTQLPDFDSSCYTTVYGQKFLHPMSHTIYNMYLFIYCCYKNLHSSGKAFQSLPFVTRSDIRYAFSNIRATIFFLQVILINCYFNASDLTPGLFLRCTLQTHYRCKSSRTIITVFN